MLKVIQHAIQRPQNLAAQLLHQMYAAQQQHLMLQTAALQQQQQQQHTPHLQSLATIHQVRCCLSCESLLHQLQGVCVCEMSVRYISGLHVSEAVGIIVVQQRVDPSTFRCFCKYLRYSTQPTRSRIKEIPSSFMLGADFSTSITSHSTTGGQDPELHLQRCLNVDIPAGYAAGRQAHQL